MTNNNPYVQNLIEMGYDEADCRMVASAGVKKTFPLNIHGRIYNTQAEYNDAIADFLNGLWLWTTLLQSDSPLMHSIPPSTLDLSTPKMMHKTIAMLAMILYL